MYFPTPLLAKLFKNGLRFEKGTCKIAAKKKFVFGEFCPTSTIFFGIGASIRIGQEILCLPYARF